MAAIYYKYRTDFNNTIVQSGTSSMALNFNEEEVYIDSPIVVNPLLWNYRYDGDNIVINDIKIITHYLSYLDYLSKLNDSLNVSGGTINNITITGTTTLSGVLDETQTITYGTPSSSSIPTLNIIFTSVQVLGSVSLPFSTITGWNINWDLTNNGLYTFSFSTSNGIPEWFKNLLPNTTPHMNITNPYITINGSGIANFDDDYWVNFINGTDFVLVSKTRDLTIYLSTNAAQYIPKTFGTTLVGIDSLNRVYDTGIKSSLYGTEFNYSVSTGTSTSTSTSPQTKVTLLTNDLPLGLYEVGVNWAWLHNSESSAARFDIQINGVTIGQPLELEPKDATNRATETKVIYKVLNGVKTITLRYWNEAGSTSIYDASIKLIRVK